MEETRLAPDLAEAYHAMGNIYLSARLYPLARLAFDKTPVLEAAEGQDAAAAVGRDRITDERNVRSRSGTGEGVAGADAGGDGIPHSGRAADGLMPAVSGPR